MLSNLQHISHKYKIFLTGILVLLFLCLNYSISFFNFSSGRPHDWIQHSFIGIIVEKNDRQILVKDKYENTKSFIVLPNAEIMRGNLKLDINKIATGTMILIRTEDLITPESQANLQAQSIQVLSDKSPF